MQLYPNYSVPQMQNPNPYQNFNSQMQNPYLERLNQLQQYQQQNMQMQQPQFPGQPAQAPGIIGRIVNDFSEITANDVPMNGNAAFFPKADGSELQVRSWSSNGTIQTVVYKPVFEQNGADSTNAPQMDFNALNEDVRALREEISARFDRLEQSMTKPTGNRGKKAEVNADE